MLFIYKSAFLFVITGSSGVLIFNFNLIVCSCKVVNVLISAHALINRIFILISTFIPLKDTSF